MIIKILSEKNIKNIKPNISCKVQQHLNWGYLENHYSGLLLLGEAI